jgi:short-subunit dehydrogenase/acyl carrier protein
VLSFLALDERLSGRYPGLVVGVAGSQTLVQALGDAGIVAPLWMATSGAVAAEGTEAVASPVQAQVWGLGRVVGLEHPDRWGGLVDLPEDVDERAGARLAAVLAGCGEDQVAVRPSGMRARRLAVAVPSGGRSAWRPSGSVLITGGTGGIGSRVARWVAGRGCSDVVLTSRSGPAVSGVAGIAADLAQEGTGVQVVACDVASRPQAAALLGRIAAGDVPLCGVLHAAGVGQGTALNDTTLDELGVVSEAKVAGAANLDALTRELELDLEQFVLFSSVSATWGSGRQPAYGAANAYLDALAEQRRSRGLAAASVAWGLWGGAGMGSMGMGNWLERSGLRQMDPDLAVEALAQVMDADDGVVTVADVDWARFTPAFTFHRPSPLIADLPQVQQALADEAAGTESGQEPAADAAGTELARRLHGLPADDQDELLTDLVMAEVLVVLGHSSPDDVEAGRPFKDLGFDSLTALELRDRLATVTGTQLPSTIVFDYPTTAELAAYLREQIGEGSAAALEPVLGELEQFESMIAEVPEDSEVLVDVTARLQKLLTRLSTAQAAQTAQASPRTGSVAGKLRSATADEVMDFINSQLKGE